MRHNAALVNYLRAALSPSDVSRKNSLRLDTIRGSLYSNEIEESLIFTRPSLVEPSLRRRLGSPGSLLASRASG